MSPLNHIIFLKKKLEDIGPYCGAIDTPVLDFWCSGDVSSGATPAVLLAASMAAELFVFTYLQADIGEAPN